MKTIIVAISATLFTAGVSAADVNQGVDQGYPDLSARQASAEDFVGVQPTVGDSVNRYHGWAAGNTDLFTVDRSGPTDIGNDLDIYHGIAENPDLPF